MNKKNILLVCAAGYATTSMMKTRLEEGLEARGLVLESIEIQTTTISSIMNYLDHADLIITTLSLDPSEYDVPIINGTPLLSGIGMENVLEDIQKFIQAG